MTHWHSVQLTKSRMYSRRAGTIEMKGIQRGTTCSVPQGEMNQPLLAGDVTSRPSGMLSNCVWTKGKTLSTATIITIDKGRPKSPRNRRTLEKGNH